MSNFSVIFIFNAFLSPLFANDNGHRNELAISDAENVIAIFTEDHGWASTGERELVLAVWPNGDCIFSADSIAGGAPFRQTRVSNETVDRLFQLVQESGFLDSPNLNTPRVPPDSEFTTILVRTGGKQLKMQSTHEVACRRSVEFTQKARDIDAPAVDVVQDKPVVQAETEKADKAPTRMAPPLFRTRLEQISSLSKNDLVHRAVWNELRMNLQCIHLTPSKLTGGVLRQENGSLYWKPTE